MKLLNAMKAISLLFASASLACAADAGHPADAWEFTFESGYLWNIGSNTDIDYEIAPTQLTFRSPTVLTWFAGDDGSRVVVRSRV